MQLTFIGLIIILLGIPIMLTASLEAMFVFMVVCGPMNGSAALLLPGSSITPIHFLLGLTTLRLLLSPSAYQRGTIPAIVNNWPLVALTYYGVVMAYLGPRIFYHDADLPSLRAFALKTIYETYRLAPTMQNITTSIYITGTLFSAIIAHVIFSRAGNARLLLKIAIIIGWVNISLGLVSVLAGPSDAPSFIRPIFDIFRNGAYAQLNHEFKGYVRVTGLFPEASAFAAYTFTWFCFIFECWLRDIEPRKTGPLALTMFTVLLISTSSSAYIGLGAFAALLILRIILSPQLISSSKMAILAAAGFAGVIVMIGAMVALPHLAAGFSEMIAHMTVDKSTSESGLQRSFQVRKSIEAFVISGGLGVGPGSFRSSGILFAILGSTGVIGISMFLTYLYRIIRPFAASTYSPIADEDASIGIAAAWAAILCIAPLGVSAASPDPGLDFGLLAGAALALRGRATIGRRALPINAAYVHATPYSQPPAPQAAIGGPASANSARP